MNQASNSRFRLIVLLILVTVIALASFWLAEVMRRNNGQEVTVDRPNEPDYFVEKFHVVRISANGQPHYILSGDKLTHRPVSDRSDIHQAQLLAFNQGQAPLSLTSKQAQIENERITLLGNVKVVRGLALNEPAWTMKTEELLLLPDDDQISTEHPVEIIRDRSVVNAGGMFIDNTNSLFRLHGQVHSVVLPAKRGTQ